MQVYVNCKLYSMQHAYLVFLYYTIPTLSDCQKQGYFNKHGHFFLWSGETTTCRSLQALQRKFGDWSLWCVFSSLGPSFWSLFLGATGFGREVVDSLVLKKCILYPDFEKMLQTYFSFFFLGGVVFEVLGICFFVGRTHGCTHHVTTPRQLGETLKAHFVVSPFGMWQKED